MPKTTPWPSRPESTDPLRSWLPVSTATTRCTGLVCSSSELITPGSHAAPSCATTTAVTTCCEYVSFGDKWDPLAVQRATCRRLSGLAVRSTQGGGTREQYAKGGYQGGQTPCMAWSRLSSRRPAACPGTGPGPPGRPGRRVNGLALEPSALALGQ